jgi:hypothetical protein
MKLVTEPYSVQVARWPMAGRHILAQFDEEAVVVYQAYRPAIGRFAAAHKHFGGEFSLTRMSWLKTNFLWMMYRSGWGTKAGQEVTLAIWLQRSAFEGFLAQAVPSHFTPPYPNERAWKQAVYESDVRLQWDPDHDPAGAALPRRAIQLGLRGEVLIRYAREWILDIEDISGFVAEQARAARGSNAELVTPRERVYPVTDPAVATRIAVSPVEPSMASRSGCIG